MTERGYKGEWIEVVTEDVLLPTGRKVTLDTVRHPGAAAIVPFETSDEILLIRQYRFATGGEIFEIPAGKRDAGEDPAVCAARELEEEVGRRAGRLEPLGAIWTAPGFTDEKIHLFAAFDLEVVPQRLEEDEVIEVLRVPLSRALEMVWNGEMIDAKSALGVIHAARLCGRLA
jgi:ADP-ribose pyrophosphatase